MKYFKFTKIDAETGISWAISQPPSGPSFPDIPGIELSSSIQIDPLYYIVSGDDSVVANPDNHFFELTTEEYALELKKHIEDNLNREKSIIYDQEKAFRDNIFQPYHETATVAGIYKYEQAKELVADNTAAAPDVRAEATARGVTPLVMANRIIQNHESFRQKEAKIAGIRGKILDRIENFTYDLQNPMSFYNEYNTFEKIGTTKELDFENGSLVEKDVDVNVHKYSLSLAIRYAYE